MKVAIYPPLHELSTLWSHVPLWDLQLIGKGVVLAMLSTKHANMLAMMQMFALAFGRLV
jgi:hypothetical protein